MVSYLLNMRIPKGEKIIKKGKGWQFGPTSRAYLVCYWLLAKSSSVSLASHWLAGIPWGLPFHG